LEEEVGVGPILRREEAQRLLRFSKPLKRLWKF
jgi:hypothetical protein